MLSYFSATPYATLPHSSSPLNPLTSSPTPHPLSSPTPSGPAPLPLSFSPADHASSSTSSPSRSHGYGLGLSTSSASTSTPRSASTTPRPLSTRYVRGQTTRRSPRPTAPPALISADLFSEGTTPTEGAMWRERLARRMADRQRKKQRRDDALTRRRGMDTFDEPEDEDERERQAQADDEEIFRRLVVLQRRREIRAAERSHELETGGSDPLLPDFWEDELDALAHEERALFRHLGASFGAASDGATSDVGMGHRAEEGEGEEERWAREAAEAEEAEAAAEAAEIAYAERVEREMAQRRDGGDGGDVAMGQYALDEEDWAAIAAMEADEAMEIE